MSKVKNYIEFQRIIRGDFSNPFS